MVLLSLIGKHRSLLVAAIVAGVAATGLYAIFGVGSVAQEPRSKAADPIATLGQKYEAIRLQHRDLTFQAFCKQLGSQPDYVKVLPFNPLEARYFDLVNSRLEMTDQERELLKRNGFVSIDQGRGLSFPAAYQQIYTSDLPVLITTDSVLHALHRSYDEILKELETSYFRATLDQVLADCQAELGKRSKTTSTELGDNLRDVDLFLGVARKLLSTPVAAAVAPPSRGGEFSFRVSDRSLEASATAGPYSKLGQEAAIDVIMAKIEAMGAGGGVHEPVSIYGAQRNIDFTQFRPRGHYTESAALGAYFRCVMWLSRADCGWYVTPSDEVQVSALQSQRELRSAVLLTELLQESKGTTRLTEMDQALQFLVGVSDNFGVPQLLDVLKDSHIGTAGELLDAAVAKRMQEAIVADGRNGQMIRSQVLIPAPGEKPTPLPTHFQILGQRFVIDSFALSKLVHDEIVFQDQKMARHRPWGMDVMAALGSREATDLLSSELERWNYSANLLACQKVVEQLDSHFWAGCVHHSWLDSLRSLDADLTKEKHTPAATRTAAWQRKQLQTQLASWAELRRDNILYAKQSYGVPGCSFPCGYAEPYPEFFAKIKGIADNAARVLKTLSLNPLSEELKADLERNRARQVAFFQEMSGSMQKLEQIARHELEGLALTASEQSFLQAAFDDSKHVKFGSGGRKDYSGWYCGLYYARHQDAAGWAPMVSKPVVADVHTDVGGNQALEVATGHARLMVFAVENGAESTLFVGPVYSYFEFWQPAKDRLTDEKWRERLANLPPAVPEWTSSFAASETPRMQENPQVTATRNGDSLSVSVLDARQGGSGRSMNISEATLEYLVKQRNLHALDISESELGDAAIRALEGLKDLRSLNLKATKISDKGVALLEQHRRLQSLDLSKTSVSDAAVPSLSKLIHLSELDLRETQVSDSALRELKQKLPHTVIHR